MSIESQLVSNVGSGIDASANYRRGQKLTISNRKVTSLGFELRKFNSPIGDVVFGVRQTNDTLIVSKVLKDASDLTTSYVWYVVVFESPPDINEEVYIYVEFNAGDATDQIAMRQQTTNVKASEVVTRYNGSWIDDATTDATYYYVYGSIDSLTVSTLATTSIAGSTATGNGKIDIFGSDGSVTAHGHAWNTSIDPVIGDNNVDNGAKSTLGLFASAITGLTPGTTYYTRAYITDTSNTVYGANVSFVAADPTSAELIRRLAIIKTRIQYVDEFGTQRYVEGTTT